MVSITTHKKYIRTTLGRRCYKRHFNVSNRFLFFVLEGSRCWKSLKQFRTN